MITERIGDFGVLKFTPKMFRDDRGYFCEIFSTKHLISESIKFDVAQANQSFSAKAGTVRGLHFQRAPNAQAKIVRVPKGRIYDVAIDLRQSSPGYMKWYALELSSTGMEQIYIPSGFAHGFCTLEPDTEVAYLVDCGYAPESDAAILWNDPALGIEWPAIAGAAISAKDADAPRLADIPPPFA